jgi:hypothetical protein
MNITDNKENKKQPLLAKSEKEDSFLIKDPKE